MNEIENHVDIVQICQIAINNIIMKYNNVPYNEAIYRLIELEVAKEITSHDHWPYNIDYDINVKNVNSNITINIKIIDLDDIKNSNIVLNSKKEIDTFSSYDKAMEIFS